MLKMKKNLTVFALFVVPMGVSLAQNLECAIEKDSLKVCGLHYVYDYKAEPHLTVPPEGYKPFYISHFGRHGARYCGTEYDSLFTWFSKAEMSGVLTDYGKEFLVRYTPFYEKVRFCKENLTDVGKDQCRTIAVHMFNRFPEVFENQTHVESVATESPRVIMSMWYFLSTLQSLDKTISISADASVKYGPWLQPLLRTNPYAIKGRPRYNKQSYKDYCDYFESTVPWRDIACRFFTDSDVLDTVLKTTPEAFFKSLTSVINNTYCLDEDQGCFDYCLSQEERYLIWKAQSAGNFLLLANYEGADNLTVDYSAFTLGQIIDSAEDDIVSGQTQLRLRFGHDSGLMPLLVFLDLNGYGRRSSSFDEGVNIIPNYNVPMGSSLQFVLYKNDGGDILLKVLLNEEEAYLPLEAVNSVYYSWNDFKKYYLPRIRASKSKIERERNLFEIDKAASSLNNLTILKETKWGWEKIEGTSVETGHASIKVFGGVQDISVVRFPMAKQRVSVVESSGSGADITSVLAARNGAVAAINGSYFSKGHFPATLVKDEGKLIPSASVGNPRNSNGLLRIRKSNGRGVDIMFVRDTLALPREIKHWHEAIVSGPVLIDNGRHINYASASDAGEGDIAVESHFYKRFYLGRHPRTMIGYTKDGWIYFVVVDGRSPGNADGMKIRELQTLSEALGLFEAINLDGGGSSTLWTKNSGVMNHPTDNKTFDHIGERVVPNIIIVK